MNDYYLNALDELSEMAIIEDSVGTIKYVNRAFCKCFAIEAEDAVGRSIFEFIIPEDVEACTAHNWVTPENTSYKIEGRSKRADGKIIWIQYVGNAFFSEEGELLEFQELAIDITKWKEELGARTAELEKLSHSVKDIKEAEESAKKRRARRKGSLGYGNTAMYSFADILTGDQAMRNLKRYAQSVAESDSSVLIEGESGTGKEMFAQAIHNASMRANGPFVAVNCGAIPTELIGSELFGYEEGAFTGASRGGKKGQFELASGGTLFLDEIGEMPMAQQVALLRVLETKKITRVGGREEIPVDIRLVCATNKNLREEIEAGRFREDLYYRINTIQLVIPPLRERREDIFLLIGHFIRDIGSSAFSKNSAFTDQQLIQLYHYDWPGNVRELKNVVERIRFSSDESVELALGITDKEAVIKASGLSVKPKAAEPVPTPVKDERQRITDCLNDCEGNVSMAARKLGWSRNTLYKKMKKHGIR